MRSRCALQQQKGRGLNLSGWTTMAVDEDDTRTQQAAADRGMQTDGLQRCGCRVFVCDEAVVVCVIDDE